jgi:hypothetical protein
VCDFDSGLAKFGLGYVGVCMRWVGWWGEGGWQGGFGGNLGGV